MSELVQIHAVRSVERSRYVEDPETGGVKLQVVQRFIKSDTDRITHPEYGTFEVQPDGSFYVPRPLAAFLTARPGWNMGPSPWEPEEVEQRPRAGARKPQAKAA